MTILCKTADAPSAALKGWICTVLCWFIDFGTGRVSSIAGTEDGANRVSTMRIETDTVWPLIDMKSSAKKAWITPAGHMISISVPHDREAGVQEFHALVMILTDSMPTANVASAVVRTVIDTAIWICIAGVREEPKLSFRGSTGSLPYIAEIKAALETAEIVRALTLTGQCFRIIAGSRVESALTGTGTDKCSNIATAYTGTVIGFRKLPKK
jgi:hypothetical protein